MSNMPKRFPSGGTCPSWPARSLCWSAKRWRSFATNGAGSFSPAAIKKSRFRTPIIMRSPIRIGVVGCGYWGPNLLRNFRSLSDCDVKVICDLDVKRLNHMKSLYPGLESCTNYDEMVTREDLDAIIIATAVHTHYPL